MEISVVNTQSSTASKYDCKEKGGFLSAGEKLRIISFKTNGLLKVVEIFLFRSMSLIRVRFPGS